MEDSIPVHVRPSVCLSGCNDECSQSSPVQQSGVEWSGCELIGVELSWRYVIGIAYDGRDSHRQCL